MSVEKKHIEYWSEPTGLEIAVVGMACRFPGAEDPASFWRNLIEGVESITHYSEDDLQGIGEDPRVSSLPGYVPVARRIEGIESFDAAFFGTSPREAEIMDPQHRLLLECCWQAMENAGHVPGDEDDGLVGIYAGSKLGSYLMRVYANERLLAQVGDFQAQVANDKDYPATRTAYRLGLGGPAINVQTACSTSLVATHLACQALVSGECDMALAAGVSLKVPQGGHVYRAGEIFSRDGTIRAFDAEATGTIFGNGLGAVVLKRLEDAVADGDKIRAVIRGTAVNNDASQKVGFTAPGAAGQTRVIRAAQTVADVSPESITYVETHGTGTATGDPMEVSALTAAFREGTAKTGYCALASVKTNIGHLGAAAGVAGLIKVSLALEHGEIPPSLHFETPNPQIDFASSPFFVNTERREWTRANGTPRRAGLSAFGIGGTNAHAILEEAPRRTADDPGRTWQIVPLSARTENAIEAVVERFTEHLREHPEQHFADVAHTLRVGRKAFEERRFVIARDRQDTLDALADPKRLRGRRIPSNRRSVAFLFSGQGSQYAGMGRHLYERERVFREAVDHAAEVLAEPLGLDLRALLFPDADAADEAGERLAETRYTQPALFTIEWSTARLWRSWGVEPEAMIGHSIGEYVAAVVADVMDVDDALRLVAERGRLMHSLPAGSMLSVPLDEAEVEAHLDAQLSIAVLNAPGRSVVSGPDEAITALEKRLDDIGVRSTRLHTSHAFHSPMMEPILEPFVEAVRRVELRAPKIPYISNVTGDWITAEETTDPEYWPLHLRRAVRFADGVGRLLDDPGRTLLEVGPGKTLVQLAGRHAKKHAEHVIIPSLPHPKDKDADHQAFLLDALGQLWTANVPIDWRAFVAEEERWRVELPSYPFERQRYWVERPADGFQKLLAGGEGPRALDDWFYLPTWKPSIEPAPRLDTGTWLVLADGATGDGVANALRQEGATVSVARPGKVFETTNEEAGEYRLRPAERDDFDRLVEALAERDALPDHVVHAWATDRDATIEETLDRSFYTPLFLVQALGPRTSDRTLRVGHLTRVAFRLPGDRPVTATADTAFEEAVGAARATALGPALVAAREYPQLRSVVVDLPPADSAAATVAGASLAAEVAALADERAPGEVVALRDGRRWCRDHEPASLPAPESPSSPRKGGVYLVTGGLGGFGLTFAEYLAEEYDAKLALVGRTPLPPRETWDDLLIDENEGDERTRRRVRAVRRLESLGAEILVLGAEITDADAMRDAVTTTVERFGRLDGVIHAAGVAGGGIAQLKTREAANAVLGPKVTGTLHLAAALDTVPGAADTLDFVLLCSSTIAVLGTFGQVDYCAANNFLDALADARAARAAAEGSSTRWLSVNWGAWRDVGMAAETRTPGLGGAMSKAEEPPAPDAASPDAEPLPNPPAHEHVHPFLERHLGPDEIVAVKALGEPTGQAVYATRLDPSRHWILAEHRIAGRPAVPGTTWIELARAAWVDHAGRDPLEAGEALAVSDVFFFQPLLVDADATREMRFVLDEPSENEAAGSSYAFRAYSRGDGDDEWTLHVRGRVGPADDPDDGGGERRDPEALLARCPDVYDERVAEALADAGKFVTWGPRWQNLRAARAGDNEGVLRLTLPAAVADDVEVFGLHPALLDVATALSGAMGSTEGENYLPLAYGRVTLYAPLPADCFVHLRPHGDDPSTGAETMVADIELIASDGALLARIERFSLKRVGAGRQRLDAAGPEANSDGEALFAGGGMSPSQGVDVLRRVLARVRWPRVVASAQDLRLAMAQLTEANAGTAGPAPMVDDTPEDERHPRPALATPYVAPTTPVEQTLAEIWQSVLAIDRVGAHDNFFELGGDSVMGISILSKAKDAGHDLSPDQLFEHQTVAELAAVLGTASGEAPDAPDDLDDLDDDEIGDDLGADQLAQVFSKLEGMSS